jgi:hypothetical protein
MKKPRDKATFCRFQLYLEECGLDEPLRAIGRRHGVTLFEVYSSVRGPSVVAARIEMWHWLIAEMGKSPAEVAVMFDRDRGAVAAAMKNLEACARALAAELEPGEAMAKIARLAVREGRQRRRSA